MTEAIKVTCNEDSRRARCLRMRLPFRALHPHRRITNVATFSRDQDGQWSAIGLPGATHPSKPGRPLRVVYPIGPGGWPGGKLRCKDCRELVPPISLQTLNDLVAQGVSSKNIMELLVLASKQQ
jgi:hypothetical protein